MSRLIEIQIEKQLKRKKILHLLLKTGSLDIYQMKDIDR